MTLLAEKIFILDENDLYKIIGIEDSTDTEQINKIYRNLAKQFHPDVLRLNDVKESEQAKQIFSKITSAYNVLKDPDKRKSYDYERRLKKEYEKTLGFNASFGGGMSIKVQAYDPTIHKPKPKKEENTEESQELKNAQTEKLFNTAMEKFSSGDVDGAILDIQTACTINPKVAKYHSCLGLMMKEKGWTGYALAEFKKALHIDPKDKLAIKYIDLLQPKEEEIKPKQDIKTNKAVSEENKGFIAKIIIFFTSLFKKK